MRTKSWFRQLTGLDFQSLRPFQLLLQLAEIVIQRLQCPEGICQPFWQLRIKQLLPYRDLLLENAPAKQDGYIFVPQVVE